MKCVSPMILAVLVIFAFKIGGLYSAIRAQDRIESMCNTQHYVDVDIRNDGSFYISCKRSDSK